MNQGRLPVPPPTQTGNTCPRCNQPSLAPARDGGVFFLGCQRCRGAYFTDELDLEKFIKEKVGHEASQVYVRKLLVSMVNPANGRQGKRKCPLCLRALRRHEYGETPYMVVLDRCVLHGFWLDADELATVLKGCQELAARG